MLCHKYAPKCFDNIKYHKDICNTLKEIAKKKYLMNIIFSGNSGCGKKTLCLAYLREIYGDGVYNIKSIKIKNDDKEISYLQSNYHIEIDLSIYKSSERIKVIEFMKRYVKTMNISNNFYKTVLFLNSDKICDNTFFMLRRIIEKTTNTARYIFITKNYAKIPEPIRSRLLYIKVPNIKINNIYSILKYICLKENINYDHKIIKEILKNNKRNVNINKHIELFQSIYINHKESRKEKNSLDIIVKIIKKKKISLVAYQKIREILNNEYIKGIDMNNTILYINNKLLDDNDISDKIKYNLVELIAKKNYELILGNKDLLYIESYIYKVINYINN